MFQVVQIKDGAANKNSGKDIKHDPSDCYMFFTGRDRRADMNADHSLLRGHSDQSGEVGTCEIGTSVF